jgi:hypothetical protein
MEEKTQLPENILIILEIRAKQTGKPLNEVIAEYKETLERGKKALEIIENIRALTGETVPEILKEVYHTAGIKIPVYSKFTAPYSYKRIKENDTLIFNMDYTELDDGDIYLFNFNIFNKTLLLYGEYNKEYDGFFVEVGNKIIDIDDSVQVLGVLTKIERDL